MAAKAKLMVFTAMLFVMAAGAGTTLGNDYPKNIDEGLTYAKQLLRLMDTDQNGKVSKREFMAFMEAEFNRLDTNKDGELDVKELTQLRVRPAVPHR